MCKQRGGSSYTCSMIWYIEGHLKMHDIVILVRVRVMLFIDKLVLSQWINYSITHGIFIYTNKLPYAQKFSSGENVRRFRQCVSLAKVFSVNFLVCYVAINPHTTPWRVPRAVGEITKFLSQFKVWAIGKILAGTNIIVYCTTYIPTH